MWYYMLIYRYIYNMYLWFNSFKNTSVPISLQGFGAGFVDKSVEIHRSDLVAFPTFPSLAQAPETLPWAQGLLSLNPKKWTREFFFEISNCSKLNLRPNSGSFFFRDFVAFSPAGQSAAAHFVHRPLRSERSFQKHLQQKELGSQDLGYSSDGQTSSVVGGDFRQVFSKFHKLGYKETSKFLLLRLVKRMLMRQRLG